MHKPVSILYCNNLTLQLHTASVTQPLLLVTHITCTLQVVKLTFRGCRVIHVFQRHTHFQLLGLIISTYTGAKDLPTLCSTPLDKIVLGFFITKQPHWIKRIFRLSQFYNKKGAMVADHTLETCSKSGHRYRTPSKHSGTHSI